MPSYQKTMVYADVVLDVHFCASKPVPARTYGPPEDCYPAEGGEVELEAVMLENNDILPMLSPYVEQHLIDELESGIDEFFEPEPYEPDSDDDPFQGDRGRNPGDWD